MILCYTFNIAYGTYLIILKLNITRNYMVIFNQNVILHFLSDYLYIYIYLLHFKCVIYNIVISQGVYFFKRGNRYLKIKHIIGKCAL